MCDKVYVIDNKTKEITPKTDIPSPRKECSACAIGCKVYVTGGPHGSTSQRRETRKLRFLRSAVVSGMQSPFALSRD
ncbi:hypothetical protein Q5P01_015993 [Channa striata]|uniref:Uncharacterized protein n=1 Tax=Channa striata TaxID=64152 RepID=A0AA88SDN7_CHASR|nr:hypothetical protein Q5P01_015993 [Channa striata]